jgi:hypothetical protein
VEEIVYPEEIEIYADNNVDTATSYCARYVADEGLGEACFKQF